MSMFSRLLAIAAFSTAAFAAQAQTLAPTSTYSGLAWDFTTSQSGYSGCTTLYLDATGDPQHSNNFTMYGQLYCPALGGSYSSSGNAYFDSTGFNFTVDLGVAYKMVCNGLGSGSLSGSCSIYNNSGSVTGSAYVTFL